jgi:LmbE family N-acetylglucosaminyl deacetylase
MATVVFFHAHPDDECILTGGTMAKLASAGHRVVLVSATRGEHGEVAEGVLAPGESLGERRTRELQAAAEALGVARVAFLGFVDSGMMGTSENDATESFWQADISDAAARLADLLSEERADVLVVYDDHGGYGHPDHIQVHRVGVRAAERAGTSVVYEATIDRDRVAAMIEQARAEQVGETGPNVDTTTFGVPAAEVTTRVDVSAHTGAKRRAMTRHASQIPDTSWFLMLSPERFAHAFGEEQYIRRGAPRGTVETELDTTGPM